MRKIIHIDADSFFASVEIRDNPRLRGKPVAVGGGPHGRGVLCTASYEARRYGVRSAMPSSQAMRLCPELIIIKPDIARYREASEGMRAVFSRYTDVAEPLSLDEAFLDVSDSNHLYGSATLIAQRIQHEIKQELGLDVSAGVAPVKYLAKIASDWRKPAGFFAITPEQAEPFAAELPVGRLPGVGKVTATKLERFGLYQGKDIREFGEHAMAKNFGAFGSALYQRAWGRDDRPVCAQSVRKSLSVERTFDDDLQVGAINHAAQALALDLTRRYQRIREQYWPVKQFVKLKFADFTQTVLEAALPASQSWPPAAYFERLLHLAWQRHRQPVRLVGIGVRLKQLEPVATGGRFEQLKLF